MVIIAILTLAVCIAEETNWAVLVAGSNTWDNYRHQSDVCHAFHVLHNIGGIPKEHIIVMMADDIAYNQENPYPGNIINVPNGMNVYKGVPKDYVGEEVNKDTFKSVLLGESPLQNIQQNPEAKRKVLNSTKDDNVFVYYTDHGAQGAVEMPYGDPLWADELIDTLAEMRKRGKFKNLVFYLEACESGSMFENLLNKEMGVYAMTASSPDEPSYAYYWDEKRDVFLADLFSASWIEDSEVNMTFRFETITQQFKTTKSRTNKSSVQQYGDFDFINEEVGEFQGIEDEIRTNKNKNFIYGDSVIPQWDVRLEGLKRRLLIETNIPARAKIQKEVDQEILERHKVEYVFKIIVGYTVSKHIGYNNTFEYWKNLNLPPRNFTALRLVWSYASHKCLDWTPYALQFWGVLVSLCETFGHPNLSRGMRMACD